MGRSNDRGGVAGLHPFLVDGGLHRPPLAPATPTVAPAIPGFAVGQVLVMSSLGTVLMGGASGRVEGLLGLAPGVPTE
jgi:hypothetical protein